MAKMIFEELGGTYIRQGDYFLPCLSLVILISFDLSMIV